MILRAFFFLILSAASGWAEPFDHWLVPPDAMDWAHPVVADELRYGLLHESRHAQALIDPAQTQPQLPIALRGNRELIFRADDLSLTLTVTSQDINFFNDADHVDFELIDEFGEVLFSARVEGDSEDESTFIRGPRLQETFDVTLPRTGLYRIRTTTTNDQVYSIVPDVQHWAVPTGIELFDASQRLELFFIAPADSFRINLFTRHFGGRFQSIVIRDSDQQRVTSVFVEDIEQRYVINADVPDNEVGQVWSMTMIAQDLILTAENLQYYFLSPESAIDFSAEVNLLQPRTLSRTVVPGGDATFRIRLENTHTEAISLTPVASEFDERTLSFPAAAAVNIPAATERYISITPAVSPQATPGDTLPFVLSLFDETSTVRATARVTIDVTQAREQPAGTLFFSRNALERIRTRAEEPGSTYASIAASVRAVANRFLNDNLRVLDERAGWTGRYVSDGLGDGDDDPTDGDNAGLIFDPLRPGIHISSSDGRRYRGERYDAGWRGFYQQEMANRIRALGYAYGLDQEDRVAAYIRQTLVDYTERYSSWPLLGFLDNQSPVAARANVDTLVESIWLINLMIGYSFSRESVVYTDADLLYIEENLIRRAAKTIRGNNMGRSNWQAWHNTAIGLAGFLLQDEELQHGALRGPAGFTFLREEAIRDDGLWFEGSVGYHFFALQPLHFLMEASAQQGESLYDERINLAHTTILNLLYPDGFFPNLNDQFNQRLSIRRVMYEFMNANDNDLRFDGVLTFLYEDSGERRGDFETLFFGEDYESLQNFSPQPAIKEQMGLSILRTGNALTDSVVLMDYGPHGEDHGHRDKLHVSLFGQGNPWLFDPGIGSRTIPEFQGWFQSTISHNTIMLNETPQGIDSEEQRSIGFYDNSLSLFQAMQATFSDPIYPSHSEVRRTVLQLGDSTTLLIDDIDTQSNTIDAMYHSRGDYIHSEASFTTGTQPSSWDISSTGYQFLEAPWRVNGTRPNDLLEHTSADAFSISTLHPYGFCDDAETLITWSGNVGLSGDATEGRSSLQWIVVPRSSQSISKSFNLLNPITPEPRFLTFDYKTESTRFTDLLVTLEEERSGRSFRITTGNESPPNEWRQARIDLSQPLFTGSATRTDRLVFTMTGADPDDNFFRVWIDNMVLRDADDDPIPNENRGGSLLFPAGDMTAYFLASGPSPNAPRRHTTIIARRSGTETTRFVTALVSLPGNGGINPNRIDSNGDNSWTLLPNQIVIDADPDQNRYRWMDEESSLHRQTYALIQDTEIDGNHLAWTGSEASTLQFIRTAHAEMTSVRVENPRHNTGTLEVRVDGFPQQITLDNEPYEAFSIEFRTDGTWIVLPQFSRSAQISIQHSAATPVEEWPLY